MGTSEPNPPFYEAPLEYCSECSNLVESLNDTSGWCDDCTRKNGYESLITPLCPSCNSPNSDGKLCSRCKYESWLQRNANAIELVMVVQVVSVRVAKKVVLEQNRPICQSCGNKIKGGQKDRHFFCTKNPECRKGHTVYEYNLRNKPQREALELAITASRIYKLTSLISATE